MQKKLLNAGLLVSSLFGYLEWGQGQTTFLYQAELELIAIALRSPGEALHPFTLLPVLGQLALAVTLFQRTPGKGLTYAGIVGIGVLLALMFVIGVMGMNMRILFSTVPFLGLAVLAMRAHRTTAG